jgi:putative phosphoesterase
MTTIGLISDIHGEIDSLTLALDILHGRGVDHILCAGDLLEKGRQGNAVAARIRAEGIPCVQGNHDYDALDNQRWLRENADHRVLHERGMWLEDDTLAFVRDLPPTLRFEWDDVRVYLTHGVPWSAMVYVYSRSPLVVFERVIEEAAADIVVLGHTHDHMQVAVGEALIVNPGSVCGRQSFGSHTCAILTLPERRFDVISLSGGERVTPDDGSMEEW